LNGTDARFARQTERSGGQKGRGLESGRPPGIFARPRFPPPPNFVPVKLARRLFTIFIFWCSIKVVEREYY